MDELLALMGENTPGAPQRDENEIVESEASEPNEPSKDERLCLSVDDKVGIRMMQRNISGTDLMDMVCSYPYHSPASLSAMSLANLNTLLLQPASVIDASTVAGKTNLLSVGVVFSNSGTRMASSGNAFCTLTIGNLNTGPAVSILLFGFAYSKNCRICVPGTVVALINPRLVAPKENYSGARKTSVTFSVNEETQLVYVAKARDYGTCGASMRGKTPDGRWIEDAKKCQHFVDRRFNQFCPAHRKSTKGSNSSGKSAMQQLREASRIISPVFGKLAHPVKNLLSNQQITPKQKQNCISHFQSTNPLVGSIHVPKTRDIRSGAQHPTNKTNSILNPRRNPAPAPRAKGIAVPNRVTPTARSSEDWLQQRTKGLSSSISVSRRRCVNTDTVGFDGSVAVPKPRIVSAAKSHAPRSNSIHMSTDRNNTENVLSQQRALAEQLNRGMIATKRSASLSKTRKQPLISEQRKALSSTDLLFSHLDENDLVRARTTASRFANEVDAEEYARSRRVVTELESEEEKKDARLQKRINKFASERNVIQRQWFCQICCTSFSQRPNACLRSGHALKLQRSLESKKTIDEKRLELSSKSVDDGGLTLGGGLEWSSRFNNSSS